VDLVARIIVSTLQKARRALLLLWIVSVPATAQTCLFAPQEGAETREQVLLASWSADDLQLLVDEYAFSQTFTLHQEAVSAGFEVGDVVYGESISRDGIFQMQSVRTWKQTYARARRADFQQRVLPKLGTRRPDAALVKTALASCLRTPAWGKLRPLDNCRFAFSAGLATASQAMQVSPVKLNVIGGRCSRWPGRPLRVAGDSVQCERSGNGSVTVSLETTRGQLVRETLPALRVRQVPREPMLEQATATQIEVLALYRSRDYRVMQFGRSCPHCRLYAAEIRPSLPGASIISVGVVSTSGGPGWLRCPASFRCGVAEFSPPDQRNASGCAGLSACRVWRLSEDDAEGQDTVQITYEGKVNRCRNCPEGVSYEEAHKRWQQAKAEAGDACPVFADPPPQSLSTSSVR
jgi:hypothetical protein